jgi:hypothetical protein
MKSKCPELNLSLKAVKYFSQGSEDTYCFRAGLYEGNKKLADVGNEGIGGPNSIHHTSREALARLDELDKLLAKEVASVINGSTIYPSLEYKISDLMTDYLVRKDFKRSIKKLIVLDKDGELHLFKLKYSDYIREQDRFRVELKDMHPNCTILNDMPEDKAFDAYKKAIAADTLD